MMEKLSREQDSDVYRMSTSSTRHENEGNVVYRSKLGMEFFIPEKLVPVKHSSR